MVFWQGRYPTVRDDSKTVTIFTSINKLVANLYFFFTCACVAVDASGRLDKVISDLAVSWHFCSPYYDFKTSFIYEARDNYKEEIQVRAERNLNGQENVDFQNPL